MQFRPVEPRLLHAAALAFWLLACTALQGCRGPDPVIPASVGATMALTNTSFQNGRIPPTFTCDGADQSPPLAWTTPPAATKSLALVVTDPDAPFGVFTHWLLYNLPPATRQLTQGMEKFPNSTTAPARARTTSTASVTAARAHRAASPIATFSASTRWTRRSILRLAAGGTSLNRRCGDMSWPKAN